MTLVKCVMDQIVNCEGGGNVTLKRSLVGALSNVWRGCVRLGMLTKHLSDDGH